MLLKLIDIRKLSFYFIFLASLVLLGAGKPLNQIIKEKRNIASLRMIGHQIASCTADVSSRILPIQKEDMTYKISFENQLEIIPEDIFSIIGKIAKERKLAERYIVEIKLCSTDEVVHSYEVSKSTSMDLIPCGERILPKGCYDIYFTSLDDISPELYMKKSTFQKNSFSWLGLCIFVLGILFSFYYLFSQRKKQQKLEDTNFHLIPFLFLDDGKGFRIVQNGSR